MHKISAQTSVSGDPIEAMLPREMASLDDLLAGPPPGRRVYCNRTLNLRAIAAFGCDMDYTLVHYRADEWERRAYGHARARLLAEGWPIESLEFDPELFTLGLVIDVELGNVVKANRFGFVKRASHGARMLTFDEQRRHYSRLQVDLAEPRWRFMNTSFSLSEACLFAQLVDLLDAGKIQGAIAYRDLNRLLVAALDAAHMEGELKREIAAQPEGFVVLDEELPLALLDLKHSGKKLLIITNSEWEYVRSIMSYAFDRFLPAGMNWRGLFDLVIVGAQKPDFFRARLPAFEVVDEAGLLRPVVGRLELGKAYVGGHAQLVEQVLGRPGEDILYVGDHVFADVHVTKALLRWRTALVLRELEQELEALAGFAAKQGELDALMAQKEQLEYESSQIRLFLQRRGARYGHVPPAPPGELKRRLADLRSRLRALDEHVAPLSQEAGELVNARWGPLLRAGNDKSHLAHQVERYADVYTSRVSNFLMQTPFAYLRSPRGSLPHDPGAAR